MSTKLYTPQLRLSAAVLGVALLGAGAQAQTLETTLRQALNDYPGVKAASSGVNSAQAEIDRAKGAYSPTLSLNASANRIQDLRSAEQKPMATPWLAWSVPINGRVAADVSRAESAARAAQAKLQLTRDDVALQVSDAWLSVVRGQQMVQLAQNNVAEHEAILGDVRKMVQIDAGRALDLTQAQVRLDAAQTNLTQRKAELAQAQQRLSRFMKDSAATDAFARYPALPRAVPATETQALADLQSPALAQARAQLDEARARVQAAERMHAPTLDFTLGRQFLGAINGVHTVASANFSLPIWQGGQTEAAARSAAAQALAAQDTLTETELVVKERIRLAYADLASALERLRLATQQRESGAKLVHGYREQFKMARRTLLELLNIQSEYAGYQQAEALAQFDVQSAQYRISAAMGQLAQSFTAK